MASKGARSREGRVFLGLAIKLSFARGVQGLAEGLAWG